MNPRYIPVHKKGERNVFCPYYRDCLDYAVEKAWEYWCCFDCQERFNDGARPAIGFTVSESTPYFELPVDIYKES